MKKLQCRRNSLLAKWLEFNYDSLPKSICPVFWMTFFSIVLLPFALPIVIILKLIPEKIKQPEKYRDSPPPFFIKTIAGLGFTLIGLLVASAFFDSHEISIWITLSVIFFLTWLAISIGTASNTWIEYRKRQEIDTFDSEPEKGSFGIAWEAIKSAWKHVCKPIDWV